MHLLVNDAPSRTNCLSTEITLCLQSVKDMPVLQDGPPPGGFPSVRYARRLPSTGPTGFTLFALTTVIMAYGFVKVPQNTVFFRARQAKNCAATAQSAWHLIRSDELAPFLARAPKNSPVQNSVQPKLYSLQVGETNKHRRAVKAEKLEARKTLYPVLQAEEDRR